MSRTYHVIHRQIDGDIEDREHGWPSLKLEMRPVGTELAFDKQGLALHLTILGKETVLSGTGLAELREFLEEDPRT